MEMKSKEFVVVKKWKVMAKSASDAIVKTKHYSPESVRARAITEKERHHLKMANKAPVNTNDMADDKGKPFFRPLKKGYF